MGISLPCGLIGTGLAACVCSFCLSPPSAFSQNLETEGRDADGHGAYRQSADTLNDAATVERIQRQQQAVLAAVEKIREDSDAALHRYTEAVLIQFNLLQESFAAQQMKQAQAAERLNRLTRNIVGVMAAATALSILVLACVPVWATHRMARRILQSRVRAGDARQAPDLGWQPGLPSALESELLASLARLEERLLSVETRSSAAPVALLEAAPQETPPQPSHAPPPHPHAPRVALALGEGSALVFLPHETQAPRSNPLGRHLGRLKKLLTRGAATAAAGQPLRAGTAVGKTR